jgi:hydrogenase maturation protease
VAEADVPALLVLGIGNPDRGDDGAGRAVAKALRTAAPAGVEIAEADGEATALMARIEGRRRVVVVDACLTGAAAGAIHRFDAALAPLPAFTFGVSSHGLGLHHAIEMARALGGLPRQCLVYAIEGARFEIGAPLSPAVAAAAARLAEELAGELEQWREAERA